MKKVNIGYVVFAFIIACLVYAIPTTIVIAIGARFIPFIHFNFATIAIVDSIIGLYKTLQKVVNGDIEKAINK